MLLLIGKVTPSESFKGNSFLAILEQVCLIHFRKTRPHDLVYPYIPFKSLNASPQAHFSNYLWFFFSLHIPLLTQPICLTRVTIDFVQSMF